MKWFKYINWIMFPTGLNIFSLIDCEKSYDLSTGQSTRNKISLIFQKVTNFTSCLLLFLAITTQSSFVVTTGFQLPLIGIEGLNLFTKFIWSTTLLIHMWFNRSKIRSLVDSVDNLISGKSIIRLKLKKLSIIAVSFYTIFIVVEAIVIFEMLSVVGGLHFFRMYSVTSFVERLARKQWVKWPLNYSLERFMGQNTTFLDLYGDAYPTAFWLESVIQHAFHLFFMTGSLYTFTVLVTFLEVSISKIYVWKLKELRETISHSKNGSTARNLDSIVDEMRLVRAKVQEMRISTDHLFSLPILISLSLLFLDTGIRLSVKQIRHKGEEEFMKKYIFWLGIMFHVMKSLAHILMITFLDNVYGEADFAEIDTLNSLIDADSGSNESHGQTKLTEPATEERRKSFQSIQLMTLQVMNDKLHRLTAWNMFIIQKSVILAFLGSVIPFAVIVVGFFTNEQAQLARE